MSRSLDVLIEDERVGRLFENQGIWSFEYTPEWVASGYELSPGLPLQSSRIDDTGTKRPVQWFFDNLLPEEAARTRLIDSLGDGDWDAWRLLETFGYESAGALTLLRPGDTLPPPALTPLPDEALHRRILSMPRIPLAANAPKKMSLAGAQDKLPVVMDEKGALFEPVGAQASTHILKPDAYTEHFPASAVNEWFCARVAQRLNLPVPPVTLRYVPSCVYLIERFDRYREEGVLRRRHTLDATQLLSISHGGKYTQSGVQALNDVVALCRTKLPTRVALFRWALLNVLIGNGDAHLKNLSLYAGKDGYRLAAHYDLVSTASWARPDLVGPDEPRWPDVELSFPIDDAKFFRDVRAEHFCRFADALKLQSVTAEREMKRLTGGVLAAAEATKAEFEARTDVPLNFRAGQQRMLSAIMSMPVAEMAKQLAG